jgi:crossover junction endodeoxyribonuclease RusA
VTVFIPGVPIPQGSTRAFVVAGRAVTTAANVKTRPWRADLQAGLAYHLERTGIEGIALPAGPVAVELSFLMPRRKTEPKRTTPGHTRKPDLDKLIRAVLDAMTGIVFTDDAQVVSIEATKRTAALAEPPGVLVAWTAVDALSEAVRAP